ncbi:MAG TPA: hypothetical protein VIK33_02210 [Anaerolineae bacterium]
MEATLTAIETTGRIDEHRQLKLDEPLPVAGPMRVRVIVLYPLADEPDEREWLRAAARNPAFESLREAAEDIYSVTDGKPFHHPS